MLGAILAAGLVPSRDIQFKSHRHAALGASLESEIADFSMVETSLEAGVTKEQLKTSKTRRYDAFTVSGTRLFVLERDTGKTFEIRGLPLEWRPFSDLLWANDRILVFDRWSQPHYGIHYEVNVASRKLIVAQPFADKTYLEQRRPKVENNHDKWRLADAATVRLSPRAFRMLPRNVLDTLQARGCTIPQVFGRSEPHNIVSGEFIRKGQTDWAVLCSRNRRSAILVFWGGSSHTVTALAESPDSAFLQTIDSDGSIGFSRGIDAVGRDYIVQHHQEFGGPNVSSIDHLGINDAFVEKGSVVHYYYRGKWLRLQGAD